MTARPRGRRELPPLPSMRSRSPVTDRLAGSSRAAGSNRTSCGRGTAAPATSASSRRHRVGSSAVRSRPMAAGSTTWTTPRRARRGCSCGSRGGGPAEVVDPALGRGFLWSLVAHESSVAFTFLVDGRFEHRVASNDAPGSRLVVADEASAFVGSLRRRWPDADDGSLARRRQPRDGAVRRRDRLAGRRVVPARSDHARLHAVADPRGPADARRVERDRRAPADPVGPLDWRTHPHLRRGDRRRRAISRLVARRRQDPAAPDPRGRHPVPPVRPRARGADAACDAARRR